MKHNFRKLSIWNRSLELSSSIINLAKQFPGENRFELTTQIIRSCISIPSNIAEGSSRLSQQDFSRFIDYSLGSAYELETQLMIARDVEIIEEQSANDLINEIQIIQKMMLKFQYKLRQ